jgi:hypothetical protein
MQSEVNSHLAFMLAPLFAAEGMPRVLPIEHIAIAVKPDPTSLDPSS